MMPPPWHKTPELSYSTSTWPRVIALCGSANKQYEDTLVYIKQYAVVVIIIVIIIIIIIMIIKLIIVMTTATTKATITSTSTTTPAFIYILCRYSIFFSRIQLL